MSMKDNDGRRANATGQQHDLLQGAQGHAAALIVGHVQDVVSQKRCVRGFALHDFAQWDGDLVLATVSFAAVDIGFLHGIGHKALAGVIVGALLKWVVPIFANLFAGLGVSLPLPTRIVMGLSSFVQTFWWMVFAGGFGLYFGVAQIRKHPRGRYYFDKMMLYIPVIGGLLRKIAVGRFTRTLGTLITSGVPILEG